jgi:hypothetical protein
MKRGMFVLLLLSTIGGCGQSSTAPVATDPTPAAEVDGSAYLLPDEPPQALDIVEARKQAQDDKEVAVVGRIGGSENPWIDGRAAFSIVDLSLQACSDREGDNCPHPWDYCCETDKLPEATALVKVVDAQGSLVKADARQLLNVKELQTVVVRGKAQRDESGNLTILADGVFVKR